MAHFEIDFDSAESYSLKISPYQFEPLLQSSSANIENGGAEEEHTSERFGSTNW